MTKLWKALRSESGRTVLSGIIAETAEAAAEQVDRALRGRPGGRHEEWEVWNRNGRLMVEDAR